MKDMGAMLLSREPFSEIVIGNTALVRAFIEAGTRVVTSYPGSPTPEIAEAIRAIPPAIVPSTSSSPSTRRSPRKSPTAPR
jgi:TPP-dependent indolepyruvate ferredoxin oxidoreductase alpha subunit